MQCDTVQVVHACNSSTSVHKYVMKVTEGSYMHACVYA